MRNSICYWALFSLCFDCEISVVCLYMLDSVVWDLGLIFLVGLNQKYFLIDIIRLGVLYLKLESALYLISFYCLCCVGDALDDD